MEERVEQLAKRFANIGSDLNQLSDGINNLKSSSSSSSQQTPSQQSSPVGQQSEQSITTIVVENPNAILHQSNFDREEPKQADESSPHTVNVDNINTSSDSTEHQKPFDNQLEVPSIDPVVSHSPCLDCIQYIKQIDKLKLKIEKYEGERDQLIKQTKDEMEQPIKDAKENLTLKETELEKRIHEFENQMLARKKFEDSNKPIHLNVRGTIITVSLGDFIQNEREPDNLFKKMLTGPHPIYETPSYTFKDSVYFIDCDFVIFKHILEWLKFGIVDYEMSGFTKLSLLHVCKMFNLNNLSKRVGESHNYKLDSKSLIPLPGSTIIGIENSLLSYEIISQTNSKLSPQLLYRGTRDGFKAEDFHSKCDNQGPTLTIIKSEEPYNQIFGGFTTKSWKSSDDDEYISDDSAFIFKIDENNQFRKFNIKQDQKESAICANKDYLATFGGGCDICITSDCNLHNYSGANFGDTYELPNNENDEYQYESEKAQNYLAGCKNFKVSEIEVFKIIQ